jgi:hypothetical protein
LRQAARGIGGCGHARRGTATGHFTCECRREAVAVLQGLEPGQMAAVTIGRVETVADFTAATGPLDGVAPPPSSRVPQGVGAALRSQPANNTMQSHSLSETLPHRSTCGVDLPTIPGSLPLHRQPLIKPIAVYPASCPPLYSTFDACTDRPRGGNVASVRYGILDATHSEQLGIHIGTMPMQAAGGSSSGAAAVRRALASAAAATARRTRAMQQQQRLHMARHAAGRA